MPMAVERGFNSDPQKVLLCTILGVTEPVDYKLFRKAYAGNILMTLFSIASFFFIYFYQANFRAFLIGQEFNWVPEVLTDINVFDMPIITTPGAIWGDGSKHHLMLFRFSQDENALFCTINIDNATLELSTRYAVHEFDQDIEYKLHCFLRAVIDKNATALMTQGGYNDYATWWLKKRKQHGLPPEEIWALRKSSTSIGITINYMYSRNFQYWEEFFHLGLTRLATTGIPSLAMSTMPFDTSINPFAYGKKFPT